MFEVGDIREWRGHDVVDSDGHKIGELGAIYVDTSTDLPAFATVTVGMPTRHLYPVTRLTPNCDRYHDLSHGSIKSFTISIARGAINDYRTRQNLKRIQALPNHP